ncbi:hypothetical protein HRbin24_01958 [bacterium HR24]|nr:hypothetical protein HRbin24_01958 [bacterium HR24]
MNLARQAESSSHRPTARHLGWVEARRDGASGLFVSLGRGGRSASGLSAGDRCPEEGIQPPHQQRPCPAPPGGAGPGRLAAWSRRRAPRRQLHGCQALRLRPGEAGELHGRPVEPGYGSPGGGHGCPSHHGRADGRHFRPGSGDRARAEGRARGHHRVGQGSLQPSAGPVRPRPGGEGMGVQPDQGAATGLRQAGAGRTGHRLRGRGQAGGGGAGPRAGGGGHPPLRRGALPARGVAGRGPYGRLHRLHPARTAGDRRGRHPPGSQDRGR